MKKKRIIVCIFIEWKTQNYCVKVPQNAAKAIDISKNSRGSMPPDPPSMLGSQATLDRSPSASALDSKDGHFVVANFRPPLFQNPVSAPANFRQKFKMATMAAILDFR